MATSKQPSGDQVPQYLILEIHRFVAWDANTKYTYRIWADMSKVAGDLNLSDPSDPSVARKTEEYYYYGDPYKSQDIPKRHEIFHKIAAAGFTLKSSHGYPIASNKTDEDTQARQSWTFERYV
ncbi:uncharacterized protein [Amphiura filiformis]|uniref:uncharacterized protein n=1 Tax=Amphiura filiformis TaxID=82378 RepID=UPI003B21066F